MAAPREDARAARERKQKIFVVVGGLFLLALLAFQLPKLLGGSGSGSAAPAAETTVGGETEPGTQGGTATPVALVDTDRPLPLGPGHLHSFSAFEVKDPFVQQIVAPQPTEIGSGSESSGSGERAPAKPKAPSRSFSVGKAGAGATILSVNGVRQVLVRGQRFPSSDPVFVLVSVQPNAKRVVVGISDGEYTNGSETAALSQGKPLVLVNETTGVRYRLLLVAAGDGKAARGRR